MDPDAQPPAADPRCGTYAGYFVHWRARTTPCRPCVEAATARKRDNLRIRAERDKAAAGDAR